MKSTQLHWGQMSVAGFLGSTWQRRPLLVRRFVDPAAVNADLLSLADHAYSDRVPTRLIRQRKARWSVVQGPVDRLPSLKTPGWTVLLQRMDCVHAQAYALRNAFSFLPQVRIEDVMISVASRGGGVGAHLDAYDVFLIQGRGRRRWRWGRQDDHTLVEHVALRLLKHFEPAYEAILEPGDALYLPPGWSHEGTALEPCSTWSVGFRAPSRKEFLSFFLAEAADPVCGSDPRYTDPRTKVPRTTVPRTTVAPTTEPRATHPRATHPPTKRGSARIPIQLQEQLEDWALGYRPDRATLARALGRFLTEPHAHAVFHHPSPAHDRQDFVRLIAGAGVQLAPATRMAYTAGRLWINGEDAGKPGRLLRRLADLRVLEPRDLRIGILSADASEKDATAVEMKCKQSVDFTPLIASLYRWYASGWVVLGQLPWGRNL